MNEGTLLLSRAEIARLLAPVDYLEVVDEAFRASAAGRAPSPAPMHIAAIDGGFHAKGAALLNGRPLAAFKLNGNFPGNPARGLPTIQGAILLCDAENGALLAIMDSIEITLRRTAAATALAAKHLARPGPATVTMCGCGDQAIAQVEALAQVVTIARGFAFDRDAARAAAFAASAHAKLGVSFEVVAAHAPATRASDIIVTCTTARASFLDVGDVAPGAFVAAVGADNPAKSEITPALMARAKVVVDVLEQCLAMGDLHHAVEAGAMSAADVHADLADIVTGVRSGRSRAEDIIIFDSTGTAIQDVASAALAYERACERGGGFRFSLA